MSARPRPAGTRGPRPSLPALVYTPLCEEDVAGGKSWTKSPGAASSRTDRARLHHEAHVLRLLSDSPHVPRVVAVQTTPSPRLVLERPEGHGFSRETTTEATLGTFLRDATLIAEALADLHARGVTHNDIRPENIFFADEGPRAILLNLGFASLLPRDPTTLGARLAAALPYMAPEHTGRIRRQVDYRADLYSLGIVLYEKLAGRLPFDAHTPIAWFSAHLATTPPDLRDRQPFVPAPVSALLARLLAKEPEDRYQSAAGVAHDLALFARAHASGEPFPEQLGSQDARPGLVLPNRLYGRDVESKRLHASFTSVMEAGRSGLVLVRGYSGVGKTALVQEQLRTFAEARAWFATGKCDQLRRGVPYAAVVDAIAAVVRRLLSEEDGVLDEITARVVGAVGATNMRVLADVIPDLHHVFGEQPPPERASATETRHRFVLGVRRLVGAIASTERPLVLYLDDLQWAEAATLDLVTALVTDPTITHTLVVGSYRDNEVPTDHPLATTRRGWRAQDIVTDELHLHPLGAAALTDYLADALQYGPPDRPLEEFATFIQRRTAGNPFFVGTFLADLVARNLLVQDPRTGRFNWQPEVFEDPRVTANVVDQLCAQIERLPGPCQRLLQQAACAGPQFELTDLPARSGSADAQTRILWPAVRAQLIAPVGVDYRAAMAEGPPPQNSPVFRFVHDRVQQAAHALLGPAERTRTHAELARKLRDAPDGESSRLFELVEHLNLGKAVLEPQEAAKLGELNLKAARKAQAAGAYDASLTFAQAGLEALPLTPEDERQRIFAALKHTEAETLHIAGRHQESLDCCAAATTELGPEASTPFTLVQTQAKIALGQIPEGLRISLAALAKLGVQLDEAPSGDAVEAAHERLSGRLHTLSVQDLVAQGAMKDPRACAAMDILGGIIGGAFFTNLNLVILHIMEMIELTLDHGVHTKTPHALGWYGFILGGVYGEHEQGRAFAGQALDIVQHFDFRHEEANAHFLLELTGFFTDPIDDVIAHAHAAFELFRDAGDLTMACYCSNHIVTDHLIAGEPLDQLYTRAVQQEQYSRRAKFDDAADIIVSIMRVIEQLRGHTASLSDFDGDGFRLQEFEATFHEGRMSTMRCWHHLMLMMGHFIAGDLHEAHERAKLAEPLLAASTNHPQMLDYHYYHALTAARLVDYGDAESEANLKQQVDAHLTQLNAWAQSNPQTFEDKRALVAAEQARIGGRLKEARPLYEAAIDAATRHGFVQNEAIACELYARHLEDDLKRPRDAEPFWGRARAAYQRWGALGKVRALEDRLFLSAAPDPEEAVTEDGGGVHADLDATALVQSTLAISEQQDLPGLARALLPIAKENTGCDFGRLLLLDDDGRLKSYAPSGHAAPYSRLEVPSSVIHLVRRTRKPVLEPDAQTTPAFAADPAVQNAGTRSVACLPVQRRERLLGFLYLESRKVSDLIDEDRLGVLSALAAQTAVSVENLKLHEDRRARIDDLQTSQAELHALMNGSGAMVSIKDRRGTYQLVNDAFCAILGKPREAILGSTDRAIFGAEVAAVLEPMEQAAWQAGQQEGEEVDPRTEERHFLVSRFTLRTQQDEPYALCTIANDLTQYRQLHEQYLQAQKMEAVGQLAGGVAHDFNNLLTVILGLSELLAQELGGDSKRAHYARLITDAAQRSADLTTQLLAFSRRSVAKRQLVDVNEVVRSTTNMIERVVPRRVSLKTPMDPALAPVRCDPMQLGQVLMNLCINARDAIGESEGTITLETCMTHGGERVTITVTDTGSGIPSQVLERIWEPFFTTKGRAGTGLGLATVRDIVTSNGGEIGVETEIDVGTSFIVNFPAERIS